MVSFLVALLESHPKLLPAVLFPASLAAQVALLIRLRAHGGLPRYGKAPALAVPWERTAALAGAVVVSSLLLGGFWFDLVALGGVVLILSSMGVPVARHFGLGKEGPVAPFRALGIGFTVALAAFFPLQALATGIEALFQRLGLPTPPEPAVGLFLRAHDFGAVAWLLFAALVVAPACEEAFFRGFLHPLLKGAYPGPRGPALALCGTAAAFAAIHCHWTTLLPLFGFGLVQGLVYEFSGSLLLCLATHFWFNALTAVALLAETGHHS